MERGDGFWTTGNKGWKTRREQQDAYRRALDDQIQERKKIGDQLRSKFRAPDSPKIQDPVKHLMPWLNTNSSPSIPGSEAMVTPTQMYPTQPHQAGYPPPVYGTPPPPNQPMANYYYMANPGLPPLQQPAGGQPSAAVHPPPHPPQNQPEMNREQQGAFAYYGSTPIPPPPAFMGSPTPAYPYSGGVESSPPGITPVMMQPHAPSGYRHPVNLQQQAAYPHHPVVVPPPLPPSVLPSESSYHHHTSGDNNNVKLERVRSNHDLTSGNVRRQNSSEKDLSRKVHVSQTSEELPNSQSKDDYRMDLARQVEEKRRKEEVRLKREQEEEERLQRKIREDQDRLQRELDDDLRKTREKEEDEKRKASEKVKISELAKQKLEEEKAELEKQKQKAHAERQQQLKMASRAALDTSPSRYYHCEEGTDPSWSWDSTPVGKVNKTGGMITQRGEGSGDYKIPDHRPFSGSVTKSDSVQSGRSSKNDYEYFEDTQQPTSASSSKTYSVSESCHEENHNQDLSCSGIPSGLSKSAEDVGSTSDEMMMCPRCARSFSSIDIQYPKSNAERQKVLNFLDNIRKRLREDQDRVMKGGFGWSR